MCINCVCRCGRRRRSLSRTATLVPPSRSEWFTKKLKKIRKAANDARDLEVLRKRVEQRASDEPHDVWKQLLKRVQR